MITESVYQSVIWTVDIWILVWFIFLIYRTAKKRVRLPRNKILKDKKYY